MYQILALHLLMYSFILTSHPQKKKKKKKIYDWFVTYMSTVY